MIDISYHARTDDPNRIKPGESNLPGFSGVARISVTPTKLAVSPVFQFSFGFFLEIVAQLQTLMLQFRDPASARR
ncbi:MAG: hypothetical protein KTR19_02445 [Hyphomicrobiales bacterium]|nr:hypothetical protein [Hyphomicrobiales bacterium]